jgi:hypothetical protein
MNETPRQRAKRQAAEWRKAIVEQRILKFDHGMRFVSYPTYKDRELAYNNAIAEGICVERVA